MKKFSIGKKKSGLSKALNLGRKLVHYLHFYYMFLLIGLFISLGDLLIITEYNTHTILLSDLNSIFSTLIGLNVSIFALSLTVYALVTKLTDGKIIGRYIQEAVEINKVCSSFLLSFLLILINYILLISNNIQINIYIEVILISPFIISLFFILIYVLFKVLPATTIDRSLNFFTNRLEHLRRRFYKSYRKATRKLGKKNKNKEPTNNLPNNIKKILNSNRYLSFVLTKKFLEDYRKEYSKFHRDGLNLLIEFQEKTKSNEPDIYIRIGRALVPPYINYDDFIQDNVIIPLKEMHEKLPEFSNCYIDFLEGYITEMFKSKFFDDTMLANIEKLLPYIQEIGYKTKNSTSSNLLFDKTNDTFFRIARLISEYKIDEENLSSTNIRDRTLQSLTRIIKENIRGYRPIVDKEAILLGTTLSRLRDILKLNVPFTVKKNIIDNFLEMIRKISLNPGRYYDRIEFFSIFQDAWDEILDENIILNYGKYVRSFIGYLDNIITRIIDITFSSSLKSAESDENLDNFDFLKQTNRIFVNLAYRLKSIYITTKHEQVRKIIEEISFNFYIHLIELGDKFDKKLSQFDLRFFFGCPIIVGSLFIADPPINNFQDKIDSTLNSTFGILCIFGVKLIVYNLLVPTPEYDNTFDEKIKNNINKIKQFYLKPKYQYEEYQKNPHGIPSMWGEKHTMKIRGSIEDRQGSKKFFILGNYISQIIIKILLFISDQEKIKIFIENYLR